MLHGSVRNVLLLGAVLTASSSGVAAPAVTPFEGPPREISFRLDEPTRGEIDWLLPFRDASVERPGPYRLYAASRWGAWTSARGSLLHWPAAGSEPAGASALPAESSPGSALLPRDLELKLPSAVDLLRDRAFVELTHPSPIFDFTGPNLRSDGFTSVFALPPTKPVVDWRCRRRPVTIVRYGGESERFELVRCGGRMAPDALDTLSILARPPGTPRPEGGLPDEPDLAAWGARREWVDGVRVVHPRLVWALQEIADAFPGRPIYLYSGYRPFAEVNDGSGHKSMHAEGRALDISVHRVQNEQLFEACQKLKDVGCGFYPNGKLVHLGVRRAMTGKASFIDASLPGEPAKYVESWPGVTR